RLCEAANSGVFRFDGELIHLVAYDNWDPQVLAAVQREFPRPPSRGSATARAIVTRAVVHIPDVAADPEFTAASLVRAGFRSELAVPMLRDDQPIGAIIVNRMERRPFTEQQIALLRTFADQAVIAIENVRLFTELEARNRDLTETLEQQTATGEILRVISSSRTEVQPVFDTIVRSGTRLCGGIFGALYRFDGKVVTVVADHDVSAQCGALLREMYPAPLRHRDPVSRALQERRVVLVDDGASDPVLARTRFQQALNYRSVVLVPMLRESNAVGVIVIGRDKVKPFTDKEIALLQTFADQAVIAIENVRLFQELQARNAD